MSNQVYLGITGLVFMWLAMFVVAGIPMYLRERKHRAKIREKNEELQKAFEAIKKAPNDIFPLATYPAFDDPKQMDVLDFDFEDLVMKGGQSEVTVTMGSLDEMKKLEIKVPAPDTDFAPGFAFHVSDLPSEPIKSVKRRKKA